MHPLVLVVCDGKDTTAENIITKIRDIPIAEAVDTLQENSSILGYRYDISNKYYKVPIYLCPVSGVESFKDFPLLSKVEGFLIHLDSTDKDFLTTALPQYLSIAEESDPECKIFLCDKLFDDSAEGITFEALKSQCHLWDVIELGKEREEEDVEDNSLNLVGYDELRDALQNIIWSNVEYSGNDALAPSEGITDLIAQLTGTNLLEGAAAADQAELSEELVEEELDAFEKILTQLLTVQSNTGSWSRNERMAYLHDMATALDNIIEKE